MKAITFRAAQQQLAETMNGVCSSRRPIVIKRGGKADVVMMTLDEYSALEETAYLMRRPKNALRLIESIRELQPDRTARATTKKKAAGTLKATTTPRQPSRPEPPERSLPSCRRRGSRGGSTRRASLGSARVGGASRHQGPDESSDLDFSTWAGRESIHFLWHPLQKILREPFSHAAIVRRV